MVNRPILIINTDNYPTFCDNRCNNTKCKKHITQMRSHTGGCKISKLRDTEECEGYISKRKQENSGFVTDSDTKKKESEVKENGRI